jgi:hypothetical protein
MGKVNKAESAATTLAALGWKTADMVRPMASRGRSLPCASLPFSFCSGALDCGVPVVRAPVRRAGAVPDASVHPRETQSNYSY